MLPTIEIAEDDTLSEIDYKNEITRSLRVMVIT